LRMNSIKLNNISLDVFLKNFPMAVLILDSEQRITYCNSVAEKLLALREEQWKNEVLTRFLFSDDVALFTAPVAQILARQQSYAVFDCRFLFGTGKPLYQRLHLSAFEYKGTHALLVVVNAINREKELTDLLNQARAAADEANDTKTDFLSNISHEVRTPIHTIVGMTELLLDTDLNKEQNKYVKQIRFSSETLLTLINHILDFSKIEAGEFEVEPIEFNLYRMIENSIDLLIQDINRKPVEMILFIDSNVPELIKGDPVHLHQIIRNLLNNAVKFTDEGEIVLSVTKVKELDSTIVLGFSIKDTGIGIDEHKLYDIFNPFFQADSSVTRGYSGAGVGLSIVKKLVDQLDGKIEVYSKSGQGSHFYFELPFEEYSEMRMDLKGRFFNGLKVLIIDNNVKAIDVLSRYLLDWGCTVHEASLDQLFDAVKGNEVAELLQGYDVGLIDLKTNDIKKILKLVSFLKPDRVAIRTKLILLKPSGLLRFKDTAKLLHWFDSFIAKPVRKRDLFDGINKILKSVAIVSNLAVEDNPLAEVAEEDRKIKILVVEDHEINREFFCTILNKMGYEVLKANNGIEALRIAEAQTFDLVFMDIQMPGMDGYEATRHLRRNGIKVPIVAVTANTVRGEIARCLHAGMNDYLAKPFRKNDLVPLINKWLKEENALDNEMHSELTAEDLGIFNFDKAVEMFMGQKHVVLKLLAPFIVRLADQIANMKVALKNKDYLVVQHEAHTIKGGALNIQATEMGTCALELELLAREQQISKLGSKLVELEQTYHHFKAAANNVLEKNK